MHGCQTPKIYGLGSQSPGNKSLPMNIMYNPSKTRQTSSSNLRTASAELGEVMQTHIAVELTQNYLAILLCLKKLKFRPTLTPLTVLPKTEKTAWKNLTYSRYSTAEHQVDKKN